MSRRIERVPAYKASFAALPQTPEVWQVIHALVSRVRERPEEAPVLEETNCRAVYNVRTAKHPPLRLYYAIDEAAIYLLRVEEYDDLED